MIKRLDDDLSPSLLILEIKIDKTENDEYNNYLISMIWSTSVDDLIMNIFEEQIFNEKQEKLYTVRSN